MRTLFHGTAATRFREGDGEDDVPSASPHGWPGANAASLAVRDDLSATALPTRRAEKLFWTRFAP